MNIHSRAPAVVEWAQRLAKVAEGPGVGWAIWADWLEAFLSASRADRCHCDLCERYREEMAEHDTRFRAAARAPQRAE